MNILNILKQLRDDIKTWVTNNLNAINTKINNKVDKEDGKTLSTNDFTNEYKNKLDNIGASSVGKPGTALGSEIFNDYENNVADGVYSHAEGDSTTASGETSHAEGCCTTASGQFSHSEGFEASASEYCSHAEGYGTEASGMMSHAEGENTTALGEASHAEGYGTEASSSYAHAEGNYTIAAGEAQHAQGKYNIEDTENTYAHIVGNGTTDTDRSNAHTLDWSGNAWFAGDVYVGSTSGTNKDEGSVRLARIDEVAGVEILETPKDGEILVYDATTNKLVNSGFTFETLFDKIYKMIGDYMNTSITNEPNNAGGVTQSVEAPADAITTSANEAGGETLNIGG